MSVINFPGTPAAVVPGDLHADLLADCQNLADECQNHLRTLETFAFPSTWLFTVEQYEQFFHNRKMPDYVDHCRQLANKMHGLKGVLGFLIPDAKGLCHHAEDLIKPLAQLQIILDDRVHGVLTEVIYKLQAILEEYDRHSTTSHDLVDWPKRIERAYEDATAFVEGYGDAIAELIARRCKDDGAIRRVGRMANISVARDGYGALADFVHELYSLVASVGHESALNRAGRLYAGFLNQHQRIKEVPLDVSRYERLVPSLTEQYGLRARFEFLDPGVHANHDFWSAVHEISNHVLKNAIIHGIEPSLERVRAGKSEVGRIALEISEDLLHIGVAIGDDGRGIDPDRVGRNAVKQGLVRAERLAQMTRDEVLALVFEQGVSTMDKVDDNAGRGIGLNAVSEALRRFQGTCRIESQPGQGTRWEFRFPKLGVSLPCFVTRIGGDFLVIPEAHVRFFARYDSGRVTTLRGGVVYQHGDLLFPLVDYARVFDGEIEVDRDGACHLMVVQDGGPARALLINQVVDKGILPIHPVDHPGQAQSLFIGATLHQARPAFVLAVRALDSY